MNPWRGMVEPFTGALSGNVVSVVGHFPFAPESLPLAAEVSIRERRTQPGDYPDPACEYLLGDSDYVFISASAFVDKTMPRLLELAADATTVVLGPSTPLHTGFCEWGVDLLSGFVSHRPVSTCRSRRTVNLIGFLPTSHCRRQPLLRSTGVSYSPHGTVAKAGRGGSTGRRPQPGS